MQAPDFWQSDGIASRLLVPAAAVYGALAGLRMAHAKPTRAPLPVLCVGNLVAGGAGKTPVALSLGARLRARDIAVAFLTRGYGGRLKGPVQVDPARFDARLVGDEALLLARVAPCWVAADRLAGARAAAAAGAQLVIMDDGFQNPWLAKDLSLLVIDGEVGFGNRRLIPAGPLREPLAQAFARADALVLLGEDRADIGSLLPPRLPLLHARIEPDSSGEALRGRAVVAFAGIGRPAKFFATLAALGCDLVGRHEFADHYLYRVHDLLLLADKADKLGAILVTTAKDAVRLPESMRAMVAILSVEVVWRDQAALERLLERAVVDG